MKNMVAKIVAKLSIRKKDGSVIIMNKISVAGIFGHSYDACFDV